MAENLFPAHLIERVVNRCVTGTLSNHSPRVSLRTSPTFYFKLPYIGHVSVVTQKKREKKILHVSSAIVMISTLK